MKDQFVIAYLADLTMADTVMSHALFLSQMLNKGLILLYVEDKRHGNIAVDEATSRILALEKQYASIKPAHVVMKGNTQEVINALPTMLNGVVAVAGINAQAKHGTPTHYKEVLHLFSECKIAYLTVQKPMDTTHDYDRVAFGVDFRKESKDKLIWASYFARFNRSQLAMMHFDYKDDGLRQKWHNNVLFMNKFFKGLAINYSDETVHGKALFPETVICNAAADRQYGLLISVTTDTRDLDIIEWFAGVQEHRTIRNDNQLPILFLNPRNDIYVLCD